MKELFDQVSQKCSITTTKSYSTSFSLGIRLLKKELRNPIYAIYGFVRFADEIVDTFHDYNKHKLLDQFRKDTYQAIDDGISLNPILNSFQHTVRKFNIDRELIDSFLHSMEMDLSDQQYNQDLYEKYILGSAEVVGLMCLKVFTQGDAQLYEKLKYNAMKLGSAFQKINFLRDLKADYIDLGRSYFPQVNLSDFSEETKKQIEEDIKFDFQEGYKGIKQLPKNSRFGVYVAYVYYLKLFHKIKRTPSSRVMEKRIRIANKRKIALFAKSYVKHQLNLI